MRKISWKRRLFLSYFFVGVVPLLVLGAFFYYGNRITAQQEAEKNNAAMFSQVLQKLDYITEKMNSAAYHFGGTEMADNLDAVRNKAVAMDDGMLLSQMSAYSDMIGDEENGISVILYLRGDKYIYTMEGREDYKVFEERMSDYGDLNQSAFFSTINSMINDRTLRLSGEDQKNQNAMVYFLYAVPYMNNIPTATIGFGLNYRAMENMVKTYFPMNAAVYIYNERYQEIFRSVPKGADREAMDALAVKYRKMGKKLNDERYNGKKYMILREISANSGFMLVSVAEEAEFYQYKNSFASCFISLALVLAAFGFLLSVILSKSNYQPIQNLLEKFVSDEDGDHENGDEFTRIRHHWEDIQGKNEELSALVNRQRPMVVASCLRRILKGKFETREEMDATLKAAAVNLSFRYNFVILIPITAEESYDEKKSLNILSVLSEGGQTYQHMYGLDMLKDDGIAIIVNCPEKENPHDGTDIRIAVAMHISRRLKKEYDMDMTFYVGRIYEDPMDICRSFIEAMAAVDDYRLVGNQRIVLFEKMEQEEQNIQYPVLEQAVYIQCLKQANEDAALKALDNMVEEIKPLKSVILIQCLCFDILNTTIKTLDQLKGFTLKNVDFKKTGTFANLNEFHEKAAKLTSEICRQFAAFKDSRNNEMKTAVLNYVNANFGDPGMGLEAVADEFGITPNYLSRFFKQETGCSFIQYVTMIRMDRAKELLINTDMQIREIVAGIGYIDVANFTRKFKSYEGVTPGQYRDKMRAGSRR